MNVIIYYFVLKMSNKKSVTFGETTVHTVDNYIISDKNSDDVKENLENNNIYMIYDRCFCKSCLYLYKLCCCNLSDDMEALSINTQNQK